MRELIVCLWILLATPVFAEEHLSRFFELKDSVKGILLQVAKIHNVFEDSTDEDALVHQQIELLNKVRKDIKFEYQILIEHPPKNEDAKSIAPNLVTRTTIQYKDKTGKIEYMFVVVYFDTFIRFYSYSGDKQPETVDDYYNYLTIYKDKEYGNENR